MRITIILAIFVFSFALLGTCNNTLAATSTSSADVITSLDDPGAVDIGSSLIHPASPLYFLKAIRERIELLLDGSDKAKAFRQLEFAQRRLREVASLIKVQKQYLIPETLEQYKIEIKKADDLASSNPELRIDVASMVSRHFDVLQRFYDSVGEVRPKAAIRAALEAGQEQNSATLQKLDVANQQLLINQIARRQAFACKFLIRESTASALNDTEKESLKNRVTKCREDILTNFKDQLNEKTSSR